jgi:hypothetical protein
VARHPLRWTRKDGSDLRGLQVVGAQLHPLGTVVRPGAGYRRSSSRCPAPSAGTPRSRRRGRKASGSPGSGPSGTAMLCQPKHRRTARRLVGPDPLEDPHAVVQGVGQHMDLASRHGTIAPSSQMSPSRSAIVIANCPHAHIRNRRRHAARLTAAADRAAYCTTNSIPGIPRRPPAIGKSLRPLPPRIPRADVGSGCGVTREKRQPSAHWDPELAP